MVSIRTFTCLIMLLLDVAVANSRNYHADTTTSNTKGPHVCHNDAYTKHAKRPQHGHSASTDGTSHKYFREDHDRFATDLVEEIRRVNDGIHSKLSLPKCHLGYGLISSNVTFGSLTPILECRPCKDGTVQPYNGTSRYCRPHHPVMCSMEESLRPGNRSHDPMCARRDVNVETTVTESLEYKTSREDNELRAKRRYLTKKELPQFYPMGLGGVVIGIVATLLFVQMQKWFHLSSDRKLTLPVYLTLFICGIGVFLFLIFKRNTVQTGFSMTDVT